MAQQFSFCNSGYRNLWMFPRNKRLLLANRISNELRIWWAVSERGEKGSQLEQDQFSKEMDSKGEKRGSPLLVPNSGGTRTYDAQHDMLGLIHTENRTKGSLKLTFTSAGRSIHARAGHLDTLQEQVLKIRYPSSYSQRDNVNINPKIKVFPLIFLIKLMEDSELRGLSDKDIMIPVVFGRSDESFSVCKEKIIQARRDGIKTVIGDIDDIYTQLAHRGKSSYENRLDDIKHIANTARCALSGPELIDRQGDRFIAKEKTLGLIRKLRDGKQLVHWDKNTEALSNFQLRNGKTLNEKKIKRIASKTIPLIAAKSPIETIENWREKNGEVGIPWAAKEVACWKKKIHKETSVSCTDIDEYYNERRLFGDSTYSDIVTAAMCSYDQDGGERDKFKDWKKWENVTGTVFEKLGFVDSINLNTDQGKKMEQADWLVWNREKGIAGLVDAKHRKGKFSLSKKDARQMKVYLDTYKQHPVVMENGAPEIDFVCYTSREFTKTSANQEAIDIIKNEFDTSVCLLRAESMALRFVDPDYCGKPEKLLDDLKKTSML